MDMDGRLLSTLEEKRDKLTGGVEPDPLLGINKEPCSCSS